MVSTVRETAGRAVTRQTITLGAMGVLSVLFAPMGLRHKRLVYAPGEVLTESPHGLGHLRSRGCRLGQLLLSPIKPCIKAGVELLTQEVPLCACTNIRERDTLSIAHGQLFPIGDGYGFPSYRRIPCRA